MRFAEKFNYVKKNYHHKNNNESSGGILFVAFFWSFFTGQTQSIREKSEGRIDDSSK